MRKVNYLLLCMVAVLTSCNSEMKQVKEFAIDFADKVSKNQVDSVRALYPDAAKCDSFAVAFNVDSLDVEKTETPNTFKVRFSQNAYMVVEISDDGKMTVKESYGIFAYTKERIDFATETGWIKSGMSDGDIAEQFKDSMFVNHLANKIMTVLKSKLKVTNCSPSGITARNDNDFDIPADAYSFILTEKGFDPESEREFFVGTKVIAGVDIKAHDKASCPVPNPYDYENSYLSASIRIDYNQEQVLNKFFTPNGGEYEEYKRSSK